MSNTVEVKLALSARGELYWNITAVADSANQGTDPDIATAAVELAITTRQLLEQYIPPRQEPAEDLSSGANIIKVLKLVGAHPNIKLTPLRSQLDPISLKAQDVAISACEQLQYLTVKTSGVAQIHKLTPLGEEKLTSLELTTPED